MSELGPPAESAKPPREPTPFDIRVRVFDADDSKFILSSWLQSYRDSKSDMRDKEYYSKQQALITTISKRAHIAVACDAVLPGFIFGWACAEPFKPEEGRPFIAHYAFTKLSYRNQEVAQKCFRALGWRTGMDVECTHWTPAARRNADKYLLTSNDYLIKLGGLLHEAYTDL